MGGMGSTRWFGHRRRTLVDECLVLSTGFLARGGWEALEGAQVWADGDRPVAQLTWSMLPPTGGELAIRIGYQLGDGLVQEVVPLDVVPTVPGGRLRFFFRCPGCRARVARLYRPIVWWAPPIRRLFRCRRCHRLGYRSELGTPAAARLLGDVDGENDKEVLTGA
jgi:hypothetical protein